MKSTKYDPTHSVMLTAESLELYKQFWAQLREPGTTTAPPMDFLALKHGALQWAQRLNLPAGILEKFRQRLSAAQSDHADKLFFNTEGQAGSVEVVERAMKGQIRASVSLDAVKSTYNHLRHRLARSMEEGGRSMPEEEAESLARKHVEQTFCNGGAWRIVPLDTMTFKNTLAAVGNLSLEDALEFQAYQQARSGKAGPTVFVTRDAHFPEGVHPAHLARELARLRPATARDHAAKC